MPVKALSSASTPASAAASSSMVRIAVNPSVVGRSPVLAARSPVPSCRATTRPEAVAMAWAWRRPAADSIVGIKPIRAFRPSLRSTWASSSSATCRSRGLSTLGTLTTSRPLPATSRMSSNISPLASGLTRTMTSLADPAAARRARATATRASAFCAAATASSRSKEMPSAADANALSKSSGRLPGTNSLLRRSRRIAILTVVGLVVVGTEARRPSIIVYNFLRVPPGPPAACRGCAPRSPGRHRRGAPRPGSA